MKGMFMKKSRILVSVLLCLLMVAGCVSTCKGILEDRNALRSACEEARIYLEKGLYQKAIQAYQSALLFEESKVVRTELLDAYEKAYVDGCVAGGQYMSAVYESCRRYPQETAWWERLIQYYYDHGGYKEARQYIEEAEEAGADSEILREIDREVSNSFWEQSGFYVQVLHTPGGSFTVFNDRLWGVVGSDGEEVCECIYQYISPVSLQGEAVYISERGCRLLDGRQVVQTIYPEEYEQIRYGGGNIIAVRKKGGWCYIGLSGESVYDVYEEASAFTEGLAMVRSNGQWIIMDEGGVDIGAGTFEDIKLYDNGTYAWQGIMTAKQDGSYGIYDARGVRKNGFSCVDMDRYMGGYLAYQDADGLWGYVDLEGNIVITPQFQHAKSFSEGRAAVCLDGLWGFIDESGTVVIDFQFYGADYFTSEGICFVQNFDGNYHMIRLRF